jgi:ATP-dependent DNA ligase
MLFDVVRLGKKPIEPLSMGAKERMSALQDIVQYLPQEKFRLPETAENPEAAKKLWEDITGGKHPRTHEGVVAWPMEAGKKPIKVKAYPEADVWIKGVLPGEGRLKGLAAGGFEYSNAPEGDVVGNVGTGFDEHTRRDMFKDPESWVGRMARIKSQGKFPSGAHRAPVFVARHEDYPAKAASLTERIKGRHLRMLKDRVLQFLGMGDFAPKHYTKKVAPTVREPQHSMDPGTGDDDGW